MSGAAGARLRIALVLFIGILAQTTISSDLRIESVGPDFMLLLAVCGGLVGGADQGAFVGFFAGLLTDCFLTSTPFGLAALSYCLVGFGVGLLRANVLPEGWVVTPVMTLIGTAAGVLIFLGAGDVLGQSQLVEGGRNWVVKLVVIETAFNVVLSLPAKRLFAWAAKGSPGVESLGVGRPDRGLVR